MGVLWLLRHAEAQKAPGQSPDDLFSIADLGLTARGVAQAERARDLLASQPIEAIYASPAQRARQTADIIAAARGLPVHTDKRLGELPVPGADYAEALAAILALPEAFAAGHEPHARERAAFAEALAQVADAHAASLVVAHGLSNRAFLCHARGAPMSTLLGIPMEHAAVVRCERVGGRWRT